MPSTTGEWGPDDDHLDDEEEEFGPGDPDYDLSEAHPYSWEPRRDNWPVPPWLLIAVSVVAIAALLVPTLIFIAGH